MKYTVHIGAVMRFEFPGIEARSQEEAIRKARREALDPEDGAIANARLHRYSYKGAVEAQYDDDLVSYLVDEEGDENYERTQEFHDALHLEYMKANLPVIE